MTTSPTTTSCPEDSTQCDVNVVVLRGRLSSPSTERELPSGSRLAQFEVTTRDGPGSAASVPVAWWDPPARAADLATGTEVVVVGHIRRRFYRTSGTTQSRTEVIADGVEPLRRTARVGRLLSSAAARLERLA